MSILTKHCTITLFHINRQRHLCNCVERPVFYRRWRTCAYIIRLRWLHRIIYLRSICSHRNILFIAQIHSYEYILLWSMGILPLSVAAGTPCGTAGHQQGGSGITARIHLDQSSCSFGLTSGYKRPENVTKSKRLWYFRHHTILLIRHGFSSWNSHSWNGVKLELSLNFLKQLL